jgi:uncharacterized OB-fold protein
MRWQSRELCFVCRSWTYTWDEVSGRGSVYSWVVIHRAGGAFEAETPYVVAMVQLDEHPDLHMVVAWMGAIPLTSKSACP